MSTRCLSRRRILTGAAVIAAGPVLGAEDEAVLHGSNKGGLRSLLAPSGVAADLRYELECAEFPAAALLVEALNAGVLADDAPEVSLLRRALDGCPATGTSFTGSDPA